MGRVSDQPDRMSLHSNDKKRKRQSEMLSVIWLRAFLGAPGMGAGYYNRFLPQCVNTKRIIAAIEVQRMESVFTDPWDVPMDDIFTES